MATSTLTVIFGGKDSGLVGTINKVGAGLNNLQQSGNKAQTAMNNLANSAAKALKSVQDTAHKVFASIRQIGQGLQNLGVTFSVFFSLPAAGLIKNVIGESIAFQDELIQTRKTAGLLNSEMEALGRGLTDVSLSTATSRVDLAKMATAWGQAGISSVDALVQMTASADKMVLATDIGAEQVVTDLGRIGNIVYKTQEEFVQNFEKMGSAINELADANAAAESEIVAATLRMAPSAQALGLTVEQMLALATTAVSTNASAERAGTQTASALTSLVDKYKDLAAATGRSSDELKEMINLNPGQFFVDVIASMENIDDRVDKLAIMNDIFGGVGAKAVGSMAAALPLLARNLELANKAYADGTSLQIQYEMALDSVKNQLGLLSNNFRYLGSIIGEEFLPYITQASALLISSVQLLIGVLKQLEVVNPELASKIKLTVAAFVLFIAVIGPAVTILGTFLFSLGIVGTGLINLLGVFAGIIPTIIRFGGLLFALIQPFTILAVSIAGLVAVGYYVAQQLQAANNVVARYIQIAYNWGFNLMTSFGTGIYNAAAYIYNAVVSVINSFIGLLRAFSPPREGPLKDIDKWGASLMKTYADAFASGDISGIQIGAANISDILRSMLESFDTSVLDRFSGAFNSIRGVIQSVGAALGAETTTINDWIKRASLVVAEFVNNVGKGVQASLDPIAGILGGLAGDFDILIRLQTQYANTSERLKEIEDSLNGITDATDSQIKSILSRNDLTNDQQAALIRQAKLTGSLEKQRLEKEKENVGAQLDELKEEIDRRQEIIDVLSSLIFAREQAAGGGGASGRDPFERELKEKKPKAGDEIIPFDLISMEDALEKTGGLTAELGSKFDEAGGKVETFIGKIQKAKSTVEGFIAGIRGDNKRQWTDMPAEFWAGFEAGENIRFRVLDFLNHVEAFKDRLALVGGAFVRGFAAVRLGVDAGYFGILNPTAMSKFSDLETALFQVGFYAGTAVKNIGDFFAAINNSIFGKGESGTSNFQKFVDQLVAIKDAFVFNFDPDGSLQEKIDNLNNALGSIGRVLLGIVLAFGVLSVFVFDNMDELSGALGAIAGLGFDFVLDLFNMVGALAELVLVAFGHGNIQNLADSLGAVNENLRPWATELVSGITNIKDFVSFIAGIAGQIVSGQATGIDEIDAMVTKLKNIAKNFSEFTNIDASKETVDKLLGLLKSIQDFIVNEFQLTWRDAVAFGTSVSVFLGAFVVASEKLKLGSDLAKSVDFEKINRIIDILTALMDKLGSRSSDAEGTKTTSYALEVALGSLVAGIAKLTELSMSENIDKVAAIAEGIDAIFQLTDKYKGQSLSQRLSQLIIGGETSGPLEPSNPIVTVYKLMENLFGNDPLNTSMSWIVEKFTGFMEGFAQRIFGEEAGTAMNQAVIDFFTGKISYRDLTVILVTNFGKVVKDGAVGIWTSLSEMWNGLWTDTKAWFKENFNLSEIFTDIFGEKAFKNPFSGGANAGGGPLGLISMFGAKDVLIGLIGAFISDVIIGGLSNAIGLPALKTKGLEFMGTVGGYLREGFTTFWNLPSTIAGTAFTMWNSISSAIIEAKDDLLLGGANIATTIRDGISQFFANVGEVGKTIIEYIKAFGTWVAANTKEIYNGVLKFGEELVQQIGEAMLSKPKAIWQAIEQIVRDAIANIGLSSLIPSALPSESGATTQPAAFKVSGLASEIPPPTMNQDATGLEAGMAALFSSLSASSVVQAARATFMSNLVIQLGTDFLTFMQSSGSIAAGISAISGFFTLVKDTGFLLFTLRGYEIALVLRDGITLFFNIVNITPALAAMVSSIASWTEVYISDLLERGKAIAEHIREGIRARFAEDAEYMTAMLDSLAAWISSNSGSLMGIGGDIGETLVDGIIDYFRSQEAIDDMADAIAEMIERARRQAADNAVAPASVSSASVIPSAMPIQEFTPIIPVTNAASSSQGQRNNITINVNVENTNDRNMARDIADTVLKQLSRQLRIASAAT